MFYFSMRITNTFKTIGLTLAIASLPLGANRICAQNPQKDDFSITTATPKGTDSKNILAGAPSPDIEIAGEKKTAKFVVDLSTNTLYKYNIQGKAEMAYLIASGKESTPTSKGVRIVTHTETYPYRTAPRGTKRRRNPGAYGPKIICLNKIDPQTGEQSQTGEFIHGTNDLSSIGKYASHGCMRMDNEVIKELSQEVKRGDIVIIK